MSMPLIVALSVGLAAFGLGWLLYGYHMQISNQIRRRRQFSRLERLDRGGEPLAADIDQVLEGETLIERVAPYLTGQLRDKAAAEQDSEERLLLARAGYRGIQPLIYFQALRIGLAAAAAIFFALYAFAAGTGTAWLKVILAGGIAYLAPKYILAWLARRRMRVLAAEIPLFVDYLRMMHGAGVSFEQALVLFAEERRVGLPVLASEFNYVRIAIKSGRSRTDALQQMADQLDLPDLRELIALVNDADRYGAGLQEPLKRYATRLLEKNRFEMQEHVGKLATRMIVVMVLFLLPALLIVTAGPGFIAVFKALTRLT